MIKLLQRDATRDGRQSGRGGVKAALASHGAYEPTSPSRGARRARGDSLACMPGLGPVGAPFWFAGVVWWVGPFPVSSRLSFVHPQPCFPDTCLAPLPSRPTLNPCLHTLASPTSNPSLPYHHHHSRLLALIHPLVTPTSSSPPSLSPSSLSTGHPSPTHSPPSTSHAPPRPTRASFFTRLSGHPPRVLEHRHGVPRRPRKEAGQEGRPAHHHGGW